MSSKISESELQEEYETQASFSFLKDAEKIDGADEAAWNQLIEDTQKSVSDLYDLRLNFLLKWEFPAALLSIQNMFTDWKMFKNLEIKSNHLLNLHILINEQVNI